VSSAREECTGPLASGVVGVCSIAIQVSAPPPPLEPPESPPLPPHAESASAPAAAAGTEESRVLRLIMPEFLSWGGALRRGPTSGGSRGSWCLTPEGIGWPGRG